MRQNPVFRDIYACKLARWMSIIMYILSSCQIPRGGILIFIKNIKFQVYFGTWNVCHAKNYFKLGEFSWYLKKKIIIIFSQHFWNIFSWGITWILITLSNSMCLYSSVTHYILAKSHQSLHRSIIGTYDYDYAFINNSLT